MLSWATPAISARPHDVRSHGSLYRSQRRNLLFVHINESWFRRKRGVRERVREIATQSGQWLAT